MEIRKTKKVFSQEKIIERIRGNQMKKTTKIAGSILAGNFARMGDMVKSLEEGGADIIHCDIMDGVFVRNLTFGPKMIEDIREITNMPLDCHLMMVNPQNYIEKFIKAGATDITVHVEACGSNLVNVLHEIHNDGCRCGVVLNPNTPLSAIYDTIEICDMVLLMSVYPGFGGQRFILDTLDKLQEASRLIESTGKDIDLEVDGGVTFENVGAIKAAGANVIVAGSTIFRHPSISEAVELLRNN